MEALTALPEEWEVLRPGEKLGCGQVPDLPASRGIGINYIKT